MLLIVLNILCFYNETVTHEKQITSKTSRISYWAIRELLRDSDERSKPPPHLYNGTGINEKQFPSLWRWELSVRSASSVSLPLRTLVEVPGLLVDCYMVLVIVPHSLCIEIRKVTHEKVG